MAARPALPFTAPSPTAARAPGRVPSVHSHRYDYRPASHRRDGRRRGWNRQWTSPGSSVTPCHAASLRVETSGPEGLSVTAVADDCEAHSNSHGSGHIYHQLEEAGGGESPRGGSSSRRVLLAAVGGAVLAEAAGQALEADVTRRRTSPDADADDDAERPYSALNTANRHQEKMDGALDELRRCSKITTLASVGAVGAEALRHLKARGTHPTEAEGLRRVAATFEPDWDRLRVAIGFSACYTGLFQPHWFAFLNSLSWSDVLPSFPGVSDQTTGFMAPLLLNQLVVIPALYWPAFFLFNGALRQQTLAEISMELVNRLPSAMKINLTFWLPAQGFQFASVPPEDQATYVAVMGIIWNALLTLITAPPDVNSEETAGASDAVGPMVETEGASGPAGASS